MDPGDFDWRSLGWWDFWAPHLLRALFGDEPPPGVWF